ncbi:reverse transcriptase, partial [Lasius niger]
MNVSPPISEVSGRVSSEANTLEPIAGEVADTLVAAIINRLAPIWDARFAAIETRLLPDKGFRPPLGAGAGTGQGGGETRREIFAEVAISAPKGKKDGADKEGKSKNLPHLPLSQKGNKKKKKSEGKKGAGPTPAPPTPGPSESRLAPPEETESEWTKVIKGGRKGAKKAVSGGVEGAKAPPSKSAGTPATDSVPRPKGAGTRAGGQGKGWAAPNTRGQPVKKRKIRPLQRAAIHISMPPGGRRPWTPRMLSGCPLIRVRWGRAKEVEGHQAGEACGTAYPVWMTPRPRETSYRRLPRSACPAAAAKKVADSSPISIGGWIRARVEILGARLFLCFKCLGVGHTRAQCKEEVDRSGLCYRCGQSGHKAAECSTKPQCPHCKGRGLKAEHRYGSKACAFSRPGKKGGKVGAQKTASPQKEAGSKEVTQPTASPPATEPVITSTESYLGRVAVEINRHLPGPVLIAGNLNAKSVVWGSLVTNAKGEILAEWMAELDLLALKRLDRDTIMAVVTAKAWEIPMPGLCDVDREAVWFRETMTQICDVGMPRIRAPLLKKEVYWWTQEIAQLRVNCVRMRHQYTRCRRRRHMKAGAAPLYGAYKEVKKSLQRAIRRAKSGAWEELLETFNDDPWARPYMIVRKKLQSGSTPTTESLHSQVLKDVVSALFPVLGEGCGNPPGHAVQPQEWTAELGVTEEELARAIKRLGAKNTAPGSDGIPGRAWVLAHGVLGDRLRWLFTACLWSGRFPLIWKEAGLVLLRKEGRPAESPSAYRPICLLDEAAKLFERALGLLPASN